LPGCAILFGSHVAEKVDYTFNVQHRNLSLA
jgi:hypothetical protein